MKILFICSGNKREGISPITKAQGESLTTEGIVVDYYLIKGKGCKNYFHNIFTLRNFLKGKDYDIFHAHYSLSGFAATFAGAKPLVVSLMGSDVKAKSWFKWLIFFFYRFFWTQTIVKSEDMKNSLGFKNVKIIPNGVDFNVFYPMDKIECQSKLKWDPDRKHILFPSDPNRPEKNYKLLIDALELLNIIDIELHTLVDVSHNEVPIFLNAADSIVLTSLWEGSPNVIKEAMSCNRPIVATNVGDIRWLFGETQGGYLTSSESLDVAEKIKLAIEFREKHGSTRGRDRIIELGLSSESIAKRIIDVYLNVVGNE